MKNNSSKKSHATVALITLRKYDQTTNCLRAPLKGKKLSFKKENNKKENTGTLQL